MTNVYDMFRRVTLPPKLVAHELKYYNQRLTGNPNVPDTYNYPTTEGELMRFKGYMGSLSLHPGVPVDEMWADTPKLHDHLPPPSMGRHGMIKSRFKALKAVHGELYNVNDEVEINDSDPWRFSALVEELFNEHMPTVISPGWLLHADEMMAAFEGEEMKGKASAAWRKSMIPVKSFIPRKPKTLGGEIKSTGECDAGMIIRMETQVGEKYHHELEFCDEYGHTTSQCLRLLRPWLNTDRAFAADS